MLLVGCVLGVLLVPIESASNPLLVHQEALKSGSVRRLKVNETVHDSGSDLVFSWARCVICDGYDVRLSLQDSLAKKEIPYQLNAAVTALRVTDIPPRTAYKFLIKQLPSDDPPSVLSGRSVSPEAPPPVEKLTAHALSSTSVRFDWWSENADGFVVQILKNNTIIYEEVIPEFKNHSTLSSNHLVPETTYQVKITAFYFPPTAKSKSTPSSVLVKTLPSKLPTIIVYWKLNPKLELHWKNPAFPSPVAHELSCTQKSRTLFGARFSGSTDSMIISEQVDALSSDITCVLKTWFSEEDETKVSSNVTVRKKPLGSLSKSSSGALRCENNGGKYVGHSYFNTSLNASAAYDIEKVDEKERLIMKFNYSMNTNLVSVKKIHFRLCEDDRPCNTWITSEDYPRNFVKRTDAKPWKPYTIEFYLTARCDTSYDRSTSASTQVGFLKVPVLVGDVDPVRNITAASKRVSWQYSNSSAEPDYFIVTDCVGDDCTSQTVPGQNRSFTFGKMKERRVYVISIQAAKIWKNKLYLSPMKMTSMVAPKETPWERVTLTADEVGNSSTVRLVISHEVTPETPPVVEYHVVVCSEPLTLWNDTALNKFLIVSDGLCKSIETTNSTLDLIRMPWTSHEVSVLLCFGEYGFNGPVNLTLPIFKKNPEPVTQLSYDQDHGVLTWEHESFAVSGFGVDICPSGSDESSDCAHADIGPMELDFAIRRLAFVEDYWLAVVTPFVNYDGLEYRGPKSKLVIPKWCGFKW